jgi:hypothetical protein
LLPLALRGILASGAGGIDAPVGLRGDTLAGKAVGLDGNKVPVMMLVLPLVKGGIPLLSLTLLVLVAEALLVLLTRLSPTSQILVPLPILRLPVLLSALLLSSVFMGTTT